MDDGYISAFLLLLLLQRVLGLDFQATGGVPLAGPLEFDLETSLTLTRLLLLLSRLVKMDLSWVPLRGRPLHHLGKSQYYWKLKLKLPPEQKPLTSSLAMLRVILTVHPTGSLPSTRLSTPSVKERFHISSLLFYFVVLQITRPNLLRFGPGLKGHIYIYSFVSWCL